VCAGAVRVVGGGVLEPNGVVPRSYVVHEKPNCPKKKVYRERRREGGTIRVCLRHRWRQRERQRFAGSWYRGMRVARGAVENRGPRGRKVVGEGGNGAGVV